MVVVAALGGVVTVAVMVVVVDSLAGNTPHTACLGRVLVAYLQPRRYRCNAYIGWTPTFVYVVSNKYCAFHKAGQGWLKIELNRREGVCGQVRSHHRLTSHDVT